MHHVKYATGVKVPLNFAGLPRLVQVPTQLIISPAVTPLQVAPTPGRSNAPQRQLGFGTSREVTTVMFT